MQTILNEIGNEWAKKLREIYDSSISYMDLIKLYAATPESTTHLVLSRNWISGKLKELNKEQVDAISSFFESFPDKLNTLDLSANNLLLPHLSKLFDCISSPITVLKLQNMTTTSKETPLLLEAIDKVPDSVTELDVSGNQFQGDEVHKLFAALAEKKNIKKVILSDGDIRGFTRKQLSELAALVPHVRQVDAVEPDRGPSWSSSAAAQLNLFLKKNADKADKAEKQRAAEQKIAVILLAVEKLKTHATTLLQSTNSDTVEKGRVASTIAKNISEKTSALRKNLNTAKEKECYEDLNETLLGGLNEMSSHRNLFKWFITLVTEFLGIRPSLAQRNSFFPETERQKLVHKIKEELDTQFPGNSPQTK